MILDEWEHEMSQMLDSFANQAIQSLGKINRRFATLGRPFDEKFRQHFLKMSNQRLDLSFDTVLFSSIPVQRTEAQNTSNAFSSTDKKIQPVNSVKNENVDDGGLIEIYDSDDDDEGQKAQTPIDLTDGHTGINENSVSMAHSIRNQYPNDTHTFDAADADNENEVKTFIKEESNSVEAIEMIDVPVEIFDPNEESGSVVKVGETSGSNKTHHSNPPKVVVNKPLERCGGKRFKCQDCVRSFQFKCRLEVHQRVHANGKLLGVKTDSNGLYHCTLCIRRFTDVRHLNLHMKSHKDNRYLYYCARCMCEFVEETKKDRHESQCTGLYFECHLCKVYFTAKKSHMQIHMRKHTGDKPFQCMICSRCFQHKGNLRHHLNSVHYHRRC